MNKLILILSLLFMALPTTARNNPDDYKVTCTLTDGTVIEGYISIPLTKIITSQLYELDISDTYKGKARTYTSEEVKRIVYTSTLNDSLPLIYESVKAQKSVPNLFKKIQSLLKASIPTANLRRKECQWIYNAHNGLYSEQEGDHNQLCLAILLSKERR